MKVLTPGLEAEQGDLTVRVAKTPSWLLNHSRNVYSQAGEDGILEKVFEIVGTTNRWCVEFGAWDGEYLSNTANLIRNAGFSAVLMEADKTRFRELQKRYEGTDRVHALNELVQSRSPGSLDDILARTSIPNEFDLLSVDIDGNDYHVWKTLTDYKPRVVVIEFNPSIPDEVVFIQKDDASVQQGASAQAIFELGREKGYEPIAVTRFNVILVRREFFPRFGMSDNSLHVLRQERDSITYVFTGYDGTVLMTGHGKIPWHGIPLSVARFQHLPLWLRQYPNDYGPFRRRALSVVRKFWVWRTGG